jgi:glycerophosphoryl diester phosphodiesterase
VSNTPLTSPAQSPRPAQPLVLPNRADVRVVAHRGASGLLAEHTLAAYRLAIEQGADALECDVRLTADGQLVCIHDRTVDRTSNGRGVVSAMTLSQLSELDFGSWMTEGSGSEHGSVLLLEQLLQLVADCGRRVELAIETKHPTRYAGRVEHKLLELLRRFDLLTPASGEPSPVRIMSFSHLSLRRVRELAPEVPTVFLLERMLPWLRDGRLPYGARIAGPGIDLIRKHPGYVAALHRAGQRVHVWTVDEPEDVELCLRLGVETIITNHPRRVLRQLGRIPGDSARTGQP